MSRTPKWRSSCATRLLSLALASPVAFAAAVKPPWRMTCAKKWRSLRSWIVPGVVIVSVPETECRRSSVYKLMQGQNYMPLAAWGHLATMIILHGDFRLFGDNQVGGLFAIAARGRSDSGLALRHGAKVLRAGADLLARRTFGVDFDGCRALGR